MYQEIEYRLYRYVVAVAEELNFSRAAEKLYLTQPSLSKQIRDLEEMLGTPLFERTKRYVRLTEAGELFVEKAREVIRAHEQANYAIKTFSPSNRFSVGCSPWVNQEVLQSICTFFEVQPVKTKVRTLSEFTPIQLPLLKNGLLDAALVILPLEDASLKYEVLLQEPLLAALSDQDPLARQRVINLSDLSNAPAISFPHDLNPVYHDYFMARCARLGLKVNVIKEVKTYPEALFQVSMKTGFTLVRECFRPVSYPGVVFRPIKGNPLDVETGIAYMPGRQSPHLRAYLDALKGKKWPQSVGLLATKTSLMPLAA